MKKLLIPFAGLLVLLFAACSQEKVAVKDPSADKGEAAFWMTDIKAAKEKAKAENKYLLLNFTGSDWCIWCIRLSKEVFDKPAFREYAAGNLVPVMLDFPRRSKLAPELARQNQMMAQFYAVQGFPTILILDPQSRLVEKTGYLEGGEAPYIEHLKKMIEPDKKSKEKK